MTETAKPISTKALIAASLPRRYRAEQRFRLYGRAAILLAISALALLLFSVGSQGFTAFSIYRFNLPLQLDAKLIDPKHTADPKVIAKGRYRKLIQKALSDAFPEVRSRSDKRALYAFSTGLNSVDLRNQVVKNPSLIGTQIRFTAPLSDDLDLYLKGKITPRKFGKGDGTLTASAPGPKTLTLTGQPGAFEALIQHIRQKRLVQASRLETRAEKLRERIKGANKEVAVVQQTEIKRLENLAADMRQKAKEHTIHLDKLDPSILIDFNQGFIKAIKLSDHQITGTPLLSPTSLEPTQNWQSLTLDSPERARRVTDKQAAWAEALLARGHVKRSFNSIFFTHADSREPELAGIAGAMVGSILTLMATMLAAVPIGILAAIYLEEFAPKNRLTDFIEVNINNLAAVPSIIFGLLGLAVFLNMFHMPRSAPIVGGLVLALMTLPVIIIASRAAIKAVPPSIREAALGIGASKTQTVFDHVLPLAAPGILTGTIIGLARALGETAPLLMIGMVAFIADIPKSLTSPATAMPVQIYLWASSAERSWESRTAAAIIILLLLMIILNLTAVFLRHKFERRW
ncbi:MAG: phosphate ABC transporter permease PstA [Robiginitomaculum sp.]|nr:phosphate ABC transporter permease PstA [Robiginitomaculum sp.]MDQ7077162.1 phosphate ABC transporter permease PstA [Robiginitomaculum sp.]